MKKTTTNIDILEHYVEKHFDEKLNHLTTLNDLRMMRFSDFKKCGIWNNRTSLKRAMKRKIDPFPKPIRLGTNSLAWRRVEVEAWLERQSRAVSKIHRVIR